MRYQKVVPVPNQKGNAELIFTELTNSQSTYFVSIQRRGRNESHLGSQGWQVSEHTFQLTAAQENDELRIKLGPAIVAHMEGGSNYEFFIGDTESNKIPQVVRWTGIPEYLPPKGSESGLGTVTQPVILEETPKPIITQEPPEPITLPEQPKPIIPDPLTTPPPSGLKTTCPNGHVVLKTFKKCPQCMAPIGDSSAVSTTTPITSNAATLIPPKPIQPTTVTGPTGSGVTLNSGLGTSKTFCGNCGKPVLSSMIKCPSCGQPTGVTPSVGGVNAPVSFTQPSVNVSASSNAASYASVPQVNTGVQLASRWARWFAAIIDNSIVGMIVTWLIMKVLFPNELSDLTSGDLNDPYAVGTAYGQTSLIVSVLMILYHAILNATDEAGTLGKMICGIRVREISGDRISFMKSLGRTLITYLPFLYIGILWIFFTEKRQTLADKICKTIVIKKG